MRFATGCEGMAMLLPWFRQDREEGDALEPRWFQWGYITRHGSGEPFAWYILIKLPSYSMQQAWMRWDGEPTWHQRVLIFKERLVGGDGTWLMTEFEVGR